VKTKKKKTEQGDEEEKTHFFALKRVENKTA
jgi:hypothetical protein